MSNLDVLNAILYVAEHGSKWRGILARFGNWHTIYMRMSSAGTCIGAILGNRLSSREYGR